MSIDHSCIWEHTVLLALHGIYAATTLPGLVAVVTAPVSINTYPLLEALCPFLSSHD